MYDVFFLSYDEPYADAHWADLKSKHMLARHVSGIHGIHEAHRHCAGLARTSHFFVVDSDAVVIDPAILRITLKEWDAGYVHLWNSRNPVNGLVYGWGGLKLFPKVVFETMETRLDMTTSFPLKLMTTVATLSRFNISPEATWRSAFRECVKLSQAPDGESRRRLDVWCTAAVGVYADMCLKGAQDGREYGKVNFGDTDALMLINDYAWLSERFSAI